MNYCPFWLLRCPCSHCRCSKVAGVQRPWRITLWKLMNGLPWKTGPYSIANCEMTKGYWRAGILEPTYFQVDSLRTINHHSGKSVFSFLKNHVTQTQQKLCSMSPSNSEFSITILANGNLEFPQENTNHFPAKTRFFFFGGWFQPL